MNRPEAVVLLHGIALSKGSLFRVKHTLKRAGYHPVAITYPSTRMTIGEISAWLKKQHLTDEFWGSYSKVHFVTHSMGGLVARRYLSQFRYILPPHKIGRMVMMGPPNQGSEIADILSGFPPYRWVFGPAGLELSTGHQSQTADLLYYEVGVIAGKSRWLYPLSSLLIPRPNDGRVAVERTKLEEIKDHITLNTSHTFMVYRGDVQKQILSFLENGVFQHGA